MILSCDPPRHAFLIHFGKWEQPWSIRTFEKTYYRAKIEFVENFDTIPGTLVAIHFVRHGFWLPFIETKHFSVHDFWLEAGRRESEYFFLFGSIPRDCNRQEIHPGLSILVTDHVQFDFGPQYGVEERPLLHGLVVDTEQLAVDIDMSELRFECGADHLKDVPATLFCRISNEFSKWE
jgi:hypothetical protein